MAELSIRLRGFFKPRLSVLGARYSPRQRSRTRKADVLLVWFPKTGGTWSRLLLSSALSRHTGVTPEQPLDLEAIADADASVPRIRPLHEDEPHWKRPGELGTDKSHCRDKRVLLLVRDPRDVMVSLHLQMTRRWRVTTKPLREFIWQQRGALDSLIRYYNIWARNRDVPADLLLVRYEDVHADTAGMLRAMLDFAGAAEVSDEVIAASVEHNRIENLREREAAGTYASHRLRPGDPGDPESFKARRGKVGGYADYLEPEDIDAISEIVSTRLDPWYGYSLPPAPPGEDG